MAEARCLTMRGQELEDDSPELEAPLDTEGAHAAGIECVGVASHHFSVEQLREAGADYVISSLAEGLPL